MRKQEQKRPPDFERRQAEIQHRRKKA